MYDKITGLGPNPSGLCMCGCGETTKLAIQSCRRNGNVQDTPVRYVSHHHGRKTPHPYIVDADTGCWVWQWSIDSWGYGRLNRDGESPHAHRAYYERLVGPIPEGLQLDHLCRNRACVNPAHLEPVTPMENVRRSSLSKLSLPLATQIRNAVESGVSQKQTARLFGVSVVTINDIVRNLRWVREC